MSHQTFVVNKPMCGGGHRVHERGSTSVDTSEMLRSVAIVSCSGCWICFIETDSTPENQRRDDKYVYQFQISAFELWAMKLLLISLDKTL